MIYQSSLESGHHIWKYNADSGLDFLSFPGFSAEALELDNIKSMATEHNVHSYMYSWDDQMADKSNQSFWSYMWKLWDKIFLSPGQTVQFIDMILDSHSMQDKAISTIDVVRKSDWPHTAIMQTFSIFLGCW